MLTEHTFHAEQVPISYGKGPNNGPPIVLLHGITGHRQYWDNVIPALARRGQVFALDLRGHGKSGRTKGAYRYVDYPRDVAQLLRETVGGAADLVGHSLGALIAVNLSAAHPELVRAVVLDDPPLYAYQHPLQRARERFGMVYRVVTEGRNATGMANLLQRYGCRDPDSARARAKILAACDPEVLAQVMDGSIRDGWATDPQLRRIECPVLLLQGDPSFGAALADAEARRAESQLRRCTFRRFAGVGHSIHRDAPGAFRDALDAFLDDVEGWPAAI